MELSTSSSSSMTLPPLAHCANFHLLCEAKFHSNICSLSEVPLYKSENKFPLLIQITHEGLMVLFEASVTNL